MNQIRRWAPWFALVVLFSIATSLLSWWQFTRRDERVQRIEQVLENYDQSPVLYPRGAVEESLSSWEWRPVKISGRYLPESAVVVRNRPLSGQAGFLQVIPFELSDGTILAIERGWIPAGSPITTPLSNPLPDSVPRELVVRLRASEPSQQRGAVQGQLASIAPAELQGLSPEKLVTSHYGRLVSENPESGQVPMPMPKPSLDEGNHLSYALQWVLFGLMAFAAFIWAVRNERRLRLEEQGLLQPKTKRKNQAQLDAEIEDAG
jgi:cytochrome oxidase assembly protein ShyY1